MDYVIVGGGVYGCATAWELARRGAEVMLLEAHEIAHGASGGPGKRGVRANGRDLRELPLMSEAYRRWPTLHEELSAPTGYEQIGHLHLIERERDLFGAHAHAWMQGQQDIETRLIDRDELVELEPHVAGAVTAALYCPYDGVVDHTATTRAYAQTAKSLGAVIREGSAVTEFEKRGNDVAAVLTAVGERIPVGKRLMLLANAGVPRMLASGFDITLPVWARLPQALFAMPTGRQPVRHLIGHAHRRLAMKPGPDGSVMISGGWLGRWNCADKQAETVPDQVERNLAEAVAVYPTLANANVTSAHADRWETETRDGIPIVDTVPGFENVLFATGWSGHGWAIAPAVSAYLAEWAFKGSRPSILAPFTYSRFFSHS